jgi:hypothetical protein
LNIVSAVMALAVLKPMRRRTMAVAKLGDRPALASRRRYRWAFDITRRPAP